MTCEHNIGRDRESSQVKPGDQIADMVTTTRVARGDIEAKVAQIVYRERVDPTGAFEDTDWQEHIDTQLYMGD